MGELDFKSLEASISGRIVRECDGSVFENEIKKVWNAQLRSRRPLAFIKAKEKSDVVKAIGFCSDNKLDVCVYDGGKSDFALKDDAVIIDLSDMCRVEIDEENKTALIEGGAKVCDVDEALYQHGFLTPLGSFSQLGVSGITLQGGLGLLTRQYGLSSDNVEEYELILANGNEIKVSAEENPDLFWGMKGYGYNFGVVTNMRFQIHETPQLVVGGSMFFQYSNAKDVIKKFRDYYEKEDDRCLGLYMMIHIGPTSPELIVRLLYSGTLRRGGEIVQDLVDLTHPCRFRCGPVEYPDFQQGADYLFPSGRFYYNIPGNMLSELTDEVIDNVFGCIDDIGPGDYRSGSVVYLNGSMGVKDGEDRYTESSFPYDNRVRYWVGLVASTKTQENYEALKEWADELQAVNVEHEVPPYDGGDAAEAQEKLKALKQQYDPENMFCNNILNIDPRA